ncbi:transcriptional regulator [Nonlabens sp. MB-3u-79]|nr:transcriptional regulator [Nonlabens sp. MB-3u-79]
MNGELPQEVEMENKTTMDQLQLIQELDEEEPSVLFKIIDTMITKRSSKTSLINRSRRFNASA